MNVVSRIPLIRGMAGRARRREELAARTEVAVEAVRENTRLNQALAGHLDELEGEVMSVARGRRGALGRDSVPSGDTRSRPRDERGH